jgi:thiol-disulfide isomerase/thioredoxin
MMRRLLFVTLLVIAGTASAADNLRPFVSGSLAQIQEEHAGKPFLMFIWSLTCTYCPTELEMLGKFKQQHPELNLVLIATDTPEEKPEIISHLAGYGLSEIENSWVFAEDMPERLRFEIDRRWYGEVPRTYFYDQTHERLVKTGLVGEEFVKKWFTLVNTMINK